MTKFRNFMYNQIPQYKLGLGVFLVERSFFPENDPMRGGRPTTSISSPNHILIIFSSEPLRNPRPFNIIFENKYIFKNLATLGHKIWMD